MTSETRRTACPRSLMGACSKSVISAHSPCTSKLVRMFRAKSTPNRVVRLPPVKRSEEHKSELQSRLLPSFPTRRSSDLLEIGDQRPLAVHLEVGQDVPGEVDPEPGGATAPRE